MRVKILGSAAGGGFPQWNCSCANCRRWREGEFQGTTRTQAQLAWTSAPGQWTLLNASPDLRFQIEATRDLWPQEGLFYRSDHYNFAKKGVPILFFTTGLHPDYHQVSDSPDKIDAEKEARFARLMFHLGLAVANTSQRPRWNADSYKRIVGGGN